jgi:programmed cell death 6-interacting protein
VTLKASASSFYFDLACCMWNLASFESLMGAKQDRTNEEGLRASNKHFQQAAGYLEHIRVHILPLLPPLGNYPCLSEDGLNMVKNLMLAQGQLCYYEKAVKDKKKDASTMKASIVAKLAKQTSVYYHTTSIACKVGVLGSMLDISWFAVTDFQSKCFQGAAEYWQAHASKEAAQAAGTGYGEEVARFHRADTLVGLAIAQSSKFAIAEPLMFGANGLRAAIQQHRQTAEHDLKTVYMESVPSDYSLAEVGCVSMVRAMDVPEPSGAPSGQLFRYVLPQAVRQANARYKEEISGMYQSTQSAAESATNAARTALSAKGLPGSLEAAKTEDPLPPSMWSKVQ